MRNKRTLTGITQTTEEEYRDRALEAERVISTYERFRGYNTGQEIDLRQQAEQERQYYYKNKDRR